MSRRHIHTWKISHVRMSYMQVAEACRTCQDCGQQEVSSDILEIQALPTPYRAFADCLWVEGRPTLKNIYSGWRVNENYL